MTPQQALKEAVDLAGGTAAALAAKIGGGVVRQNVEHWLKGDRGAPAGHCPAIERETGVSCESLRPEVDWGVLRGGPITQNSELAEG